MSSKENRGINIGNIVIENPQKEKLLAVFFDENLLLDVTLKTCDMKASRKLQALARVAPTWIYKKENFSQFSYCLLVWMGHSRTLNNKINRLLERFLRLIYNNKQLTFEELLEKDDSVSIHIGNLQALVIQMCKVVSGGSTEIMKEIFRICEESGKFSLKRHRKSFILGN